MRHRVINPERVRVTNPMTREVRTREATRGAKALTSSSAPHYRVGLHPTHPPRVKSWTYSSASLVRSISSGIKLGGAKLGELTCSYGWFPHTSQGT